MEQHGVSSFVAFVRGVVHVGSLSMLVAVPALAACAPKVSAGEWACPADGGADGGASQPPAETDPVTVPWSTGFENGFCDYTQAAGYCYGNQPYVLVTEPHRPGGRHAAEFRVNGEKGGGLDVQTRCVRQGEFPESAFYGAWYFIPEALKDNGDQVWNLLHFEGQAMPDSRLWDVSLAPGLRAGDWELIVYDPVSKDTYRSADHRAVPIGAWFHIELFLKRASDSTGKIALYQDGVLLFERSNLKSDASKFTQWYVGNFAASATPADSRVYVDDVSISATLSSTTATP